VAQKVQVVLTCDLDDVETTAVASVAFVYDGQRYEFELCQRHLDEFNATMGRYAGSARRARPPGRTAPVELGAIREWARANGHPVSDRGRIAASVRRAYDAAHYN
jgi:hypothetical protein